MSLNVHSHIIAEPHIAGLSGAKGLGVCTLKFSVLFHVVNSAPSDDTAMRIDTLSAMVSVTSSSGSTSYLASGRFEAPIVLRRFPHAGKTAALLLVDLNESQLVALDELRGTGGVTFQVALKGMAHSSLDAHPVEEVLRYPLNLSQWSELIGDLGFADAFVVSVEIPVDSCRSFPAVTQLLRAARRHLVAGEYDTVVSTCRQVLDSLSAQIDARDSVIVARDRKPTRIRDQSKLQRALAIFDSVRHYSHLAHHVDSNGQPEVYSRREATMILTATCALAATAMGW
ncbi:hypothetical protein [Burkholderia ambifaria]|uniref:hypothetical protein n=1 Tax=Burkholderia ambifaria TaxID=152480 RepID=UPI00158EB300|nr:hypothetical protein [Burkholderia ambifaria]